MTNSTFSARINALNANLLRLQDQFAAKGGDPKKAGLNVLNMLGKGKKGQNHPMYLSLEVNAYIDSMVEDTSVVTELFVGNPKIGMRMVQLMSALRSADYLNIDRTSAKGLYALILAGELSLNRDALTELITRFRHESNLPANTRGISKMTLSRLFKGDVSPDTVQTQISRTFGSNGFSNQLGMTFANGRTNSEYFLNLDSPIVKRFKHLVENATEGQLESMGASA